MILPLFIAGFVFVAGCEEDPQFDAPPTEEPMEQDPFEMPDDDFDEAPDDEGIPDDDFDF